MVSKKLLIAIGFSTSVANAACHENQAHSISDDEKFMELYDSAFASVGARPGDWNRATNYLLISDERGAIRMDDLAGGFSDCSEQDLDIFHTTLMAKR